MSTPRQHVAVIGTGMAGLVTAYILRNDPQGRFEVEVFEKVVPISESILRSQVSSEPRS